MRTKKILSSTQFGPETFLYKGLVEAIGNIIKKNRPIISVPPAIGYIAGLLIGKLVDDGLITLMRLMA